ncbi:UMP-CMP kinase-like [Sycon ciliatum]|uniref:UMP-CMP kinase-like n=1 Tax=Sycon ciliatum TaxID=27933 RepID=UPI0031F71064
MFFSRGFGRFMSTVMSAARPSVVFVLGGPGAGKGTQCSRIVQEFGYVHLSAGDLLRSERASGSADGDLIEGHIQAGSIVPVEITVRLLEKAMIKSGGDKFLVDGFPRNEDNLKGWEDHMGEKANVNFCLFFECPEDLCVERAMSRGQSSGRSDDNPEVFQKRYQTYLKSTMPIVNKFQTRDQLKTVSGVPGPDKVYAEVRKLFA